MAAGVLATLSFLLVVTGVAAWIERKGVYLKEGELAPKFGWLLWGVYESGSRGYLTFFLVRAPGFHWEYDIFHDRWGFAQHIHQWVEGQGWSTVCDFEAPQDQA